MRRHRLFQAAAGLTFLPAIACAAVYDFKSTEVSALGDPTFSFVLDTSSAVSANNSTSFPGVTIDESGTKVFGNTITLVSPTELASPLFFFIDTDLPGPKAFGDGSGPTIKFNVGSFTIADGFTDGEGTLSIAEAPASAAPEPARGS